MVTTVGITGGIGSGKSLVSRILAIWGYPVYDADLQARRLMDSSPRIRTQLQQMFGPSVYCGDTLNRSLLAEIIFNDNTARQQVNAVVHPEVKAGFRTWAASGRSPVAFLESAILFESGFQDTVDQIWVVTAPEPLRIGRVIRRDGWTEEHIRRRIASQISEEEKIRQAHTVICNDDIQPLVPQIQKALRALPH